MDGKPWYLSKTIILQVVSAGLTIAAGFGLALTPEQTAAVTGLVVPILTAIDRLFFTKKTLTN